MAAEVTVQELQAALASGRALALIDVRETVEYNLAHIPGSCSLPRRQIEWRTPDLVPFRGTRTVVCDDDGRRATLAASTLAAMGYTDAGVLRGGLNRWVTDGLATEWGVNVPSKDFGEKLLIEGGVPEITADELEARLRSGEKLLILDSRTPEEHQRACIPGSRSMPGAELGLRIWDLIDDPETPVVVHCAGRTRSIVGAGTLRKLGLRNVRALRNGTMGWELAGLTLETGSQRLDLPAPTAGSVARAESLARRIATDAGVEFVDVDGLRSVMARAERENVYAIDVRTREEYAAGHIPGFRWAPGGQAVQATDNYVAVRDASFVFACDGVARAAMTASWFRDMGYERVYVVDGGTGAWQRAGLDLRGGRDETPPSGYEAAAARVAQVSPLVISESLARDPEVALIFVGTSEEFSAGHVPGSQWLPRGWLELRIGEVVAPGSRVVVSCADGVASLLAAATLLDLGYEEVEVVEGGTAAWRAAGLQLESGLTGVTRAPDDVLPARRSYAEMLNYLRWEEELGEKYAAHKA